MILSLLVLILLLGFSVAQYTVLEKNLHAAGYFLSYSDLRNYAESAIDLAFHDIQYNVSGNEGRLGTSNWTLENDVGRDGFAGSNDEGELDGLPTPGEPNTNPLSIGPADFGARFLVHVENTAFPGVLRVVATVFNGTGSATIETSFKRKVIEIPKAGAFLAPDAVLNLGGSAFVIDGVDQNPDGTLGSAPAVPGIGTTTGDPPGSNQAAFLPQIAPDQYDQIRGAGGSPSLSETETVDFDFDDTFNTLEGMKTETMAPGTYTDASLGNYSMGDYGITYVSGALALEGQGEGAGVLIVDGSLDISGQFTFYGLVIVRGETTFSGGGSGVQLWGSLMVGQSSSLSVSGTSDIYYSSSVLGNVRSLLDSHAKYKVVYYNDK